MTGDDFKAQRLLGREIAIDLSLSPDGTELIYVREDYQSGSVNRSLFRLPTDGTGSSHRLTRVANAESPKWSPDGNRVAFLGSRPVDPERRSEHGGDSTENTRQVWVYDLQRGGDARQVTARKHGVSEFDWGPEGRRLVIASPDEDSEHRFDPEITEAFVTERLHYKPFLGSQADLTPYLYVVDIDSGEAKKLEGAYGAGVQRHNVGMEPRWNPVTEQIAFITNKTENPDDSFVMDVYVTSADRNDVRKITDGEMLASRLKWSPDGRRLAFVGENPTDKYEHNELFVTGGDLTEYRSNSKGLDRSVGTWFARKDVIDWKTNSTLLASIPDEGKTRFVEFDADDRTWERTFDDQGEFDTVADFDVANETLVAVLETPVSHDVHAASLSNGGATETFDDFEPVTDFNPTYIAEEEHPTRKKFSFKSGDGERVEAFAYFPPDVDPDDTGSLPTIVHVHHGMRGFDEPEFALGNAFWTNRGYALLRINYRGSASYGYDFAAEIRSDWGTRGVADIREAVDVAIEEGWSDPDRLFAMGYSRGATLTGHLLTQTDRFAAATLDRGTYDYYASYGTTYLHKRHENEFGLPWERPEKQREVSVTPDVDKIDTPALVVAAGHDTMASPAQSEQLYVRLKKRGVPARFVMYPEHGHFFPYPKLHIHRMKHTRKWFEKFG